MNWVFSDYPTLRGDLPELPDPEPAPWRWRDEQHHTDAGGTSFEH
jgi:hypothetical protein